MSMSYKKNESICFKIIFPELVMKKKNLAPNQQRKTQKNKLNTKTRDLLLFISTWEPQTQSDHFQISPKEIRFSVLTSESVKTKISQNTGSNLSTSKTVKPVHLKQICQQTETL